MGARLSDSEICNVKEGVYLDQYVKDKFIGMHSWIHMGEVEQRGIKAPGNSGGEGRSGRVSVQW